MHAIGYEFFCQMTREQFVDESLISGAQIEFSQGVGGCEAALFASDIGDMYLKYLKYKNWPHQCEAMRYTDLGGVCQGCIRIDHPEAFSWLRFESGTHRVQRVPVTDRTGRIHTSTASVFVSPLIQQADSVDEIVNMKDLTVESFCSSAPGGQKVNKTLSACRVKHLPSNTIVECQEERYFGVNRTRAINKLANMYFFFVAIKIFYLHE